MKSINAAIGLDCFSRLVCICNSRHPEYGNHPTLSGKVIDEAISYCIERVYYEINSKLSGENLPTPIVPPETIKSQKLYNLYQIAKSMRKNGKTNAHIVHYMNVNKEPTSDDVFGPRPLKQIALKPTKWKKEDVDFLLDTDALNECLAKLNSRPQRSATSTVTAVKP